MTGFTTVDFVETAHFRPPFGSNAPSGRWSVINAGYRAPVRSPRGRDILGACGELKSESLRCRASHEREAAPPLAQRLLSQIGAERTLAVGLKFGSILPKRVER